MINTNTRSVYEGYKMGLGSMGDNVNSWLRWDDLPSFARYQFAAGDPTAKVRFVACFADYEPVSRDPNRGMDRRHGLRVLRDLGLESPTTADVIALAARTIKSGEVARLCEKDGYERKVACLVPFNPESPDFYYFGSGIAGSQFFRRYYERIRDEDNLYLWPHQHCHDQGDECIPGQEFWEYHFPLLLGIRRS